MDLKLGEKIKALRKEKNISQEVLAQYLGVSFQAVSKWENGAALPDVTLIPAVALFFGVSTDQLFGINLLEIEKQIDEIRLRAADCRDGEPEKAEQILRDGLKKFPGNDVLLNNLIYVLRGPERRAERITICKALIEGTRDDEVKYDACRILAETYKAMGEYELAKAELERIPELYFTKLQIQALLLEGEDVFRPAYIQKNLAAETLVDMFLRLASYYERKGRMDMAEQQLTVCAKVIEALSRDIVLEEGSDIYCRTFYEYCGKQVLEQLRAWKKDGHTPPVKQNG